MFFPLLQSESPATAALYGHERSWRGDGDRHVSCEHDSRPRMTVLTRRWSEGGPAV